MRSIRAATVFAATVIVAAQVSAQEPAASESADRTGVAPGRLEEMGPADEGIIFTRDHGGKLDLFVGRIADGRVERLFAASDIERRGAAWSPAANRLLYVESTPEGSKLILFDPETGERTLIHQVLDPDHNFWSVWAPDGKHLAFTRPTNLPDRHRAVREYDLATGTHHRFGSATYTMEFLRPSYAPASRTAVAQRRGELFAQQIWRLERGKMAQQITRPTERYDHAAVFTRDGEWIVFSSRIGDAPNRLNRIRPDGSDRRPLHYHRGGDARSPAASPTRDEFAFVSERSGRPDIYIASLEGEAIRNLTRSIHRNEKNPIWSSDGNRLTFVLNASRRVGGAQSRVVVSSRSGVILFETRGRNPSFMSVRP